MARYGGGFRYGGSRYGGDYHGGPYAGRNRDEELRSAVRWSLFEDTWLNARNIEIEVQAGVVTLTGTVKDHMEARYAWDDAWETPGVRGVISQLEIG